MIVILATSGDVVFFPEYLEYYEKSFIKDPIERRGADQNLWIWETADYSRDYIVVADVSRGDGKDYSAFHVMDTENNVQVAEYKGQIGTKDYGHLLVGIATEYNEALLVIENANIGWATIQTVLDRNYNNFIILKKVNIQMLILILTNTGSFKNGSWIYYVFKN